MKIIQIRDLFPQTNTPRFNFGAWIDSQSGHTMLLGREVYGPAPYHLPAMGNLLLAEFDDGNKISERVAWEPQDKLTLLEDPRVSKFGNNLHIGLSAVEKIENRWIAYPAIAITEENNFDLDNISAITAFGPGKNTTALDENTWLFRPADSFFNHKLLVFNYANKIPTKLGEIPLPENFDWARFKFGSSIPPVWIDEKKALFLVHGITYLQGIYIYSLGRGILERSGDNFTATIHPEPIITPDTFTQFGIKELNPEDRRVVYCCGGIANGDVLSLFLNIGDHKTCELKVSIKELMDI